jgi:hypothetical protein
VPDAAQSEDAVPPDAPPPACAHPLVVDFADGFPGPSLDAVWGVESGDGGTVAVKPPPTPSAPDGGSALVAAATVAADAAGWAFASTLFVQLPPLRSIDLSYAVHLAPSAFHAEVGCDIFLRPAGKLDELVRFALERHTSGDLQLGWSMYVDGGEPARERQPIGVNAGGEAGWFRVALHVDLPTTDRADLTIEVQTPTGSVKAASLTGAALLPGLAELGLRCGVLFADQSEGTIDVAVDDVALSACPR